MFNNPVVFFQKTIDVIKVDIEGSEWPFLTQVLTTNLLENVKQIIFEIHTPRIGHMTVKDFAHLYNLLATLRQTWKFRLYYYRLGKCCNGFSTLIPHNVTGGMGELCCYELYYVNSSFVK